jgi:hypothetical protein
MEKMGEKRKEKEKAHVSPDSPTSPAIHTIHTEKKGSNATKYHTQPDLNQ